MSNVAKVLLAIIVLLMVCLLFRCSPSTPKGVVEMHLENNCLRTGIYYDGELLEHSYDCDVDSLTIVRRQAQGIQRIKDHEKILNLINELNK